MLGLLLQTTTSAFLNQCQTNLTYLDQNGWINITFLVVMVSMAVAAAVYGISGILNANARERLRGVVKFEFVQGIFSMVLIVVLFSGSLLACNIGASLTSNAVGIGGVGASSTLAVSGCNGAYQDPFWFADCYMGNLLFSKGINLATGMISEGTIFVIDAGLIQGLFSTVSLGIPSSSIGSTASIGYSIGMSGNDEGSTVIYEYSYVLNALLAPILIVTFGLLFVVFLSLPVIEAIAFTLIIPVAIIMRSLSFTGPRLREASNAMIALAVAFYLVFPLTISLNSYIVNWTYCISASCNPYSSALFPPTGTQTSNPYTLQNLPVDQLFAYNDPTTALGSLSIPFNFYYFAINSNTGIAGVAGQIESALESLPNVINLFVNETAQYLFESIFLIALDVGVTIGFALGLYKGLESLGQIIGVGPFWSG